MHTFLRESRRFPSRSRRNALAQSAPAPIQETNPAAKLRVDKWRSAPLVAPVSVSLPTAPSANRGRSPGAYARCGVPRVRLAPLWLGGAFGGFPLGASNSLPSAVLHHWAEASCLASQPIPHDSLTRWSRYKTYQRCASVPSPASCTFRQISRIRSEGNGLPSGPGTTMPPEQDEKCATNGISMGRG